MIYRVSLDAQVQQLPLQAHSALVTPEIRTPGSGRTLDQVSTLCVSLQLWFVYDGNVYKSEPEIFSTSSHWSMQDEAESAQPSSRSRDLVRKIDVILTELVKLVDQFSTCYIALAKLSTSDRKLAIEEDQGAGNNWSYTWYMNTKWMEVGYSLCVATP